MLNNTNNSPLFYEYYAQWVDVYKKGAIREATMAKYLMTQKWIQKLAPELKVSELTRTAYQQLLNDLQLMFRSHFVHMLSSDIIYAIHKHPFSQIPFWVKRRETVGLRRMEMLKCIIHGLFGI